MKGIISFAITLIFMGNVVAQQKNGTLRGIIHTADNKPASLVTVSLNNSKKNTLSAEDGSFVIRNIAPGKYEVNVSLVGYKPVSREVSIVAGLTRNVNFQLEISETELEEVIVKSGAGTYKTNNPSSSLRIQEPLLEIPQNVQIVNSNALRDQQVISMSDGLIRNVSGAVRLEHWGDLYTNITSRGSQIQAFRNGFNVVNSYWGPLTEDMSFVDHIEFVKGPAGFMLANGDPSGMYNVVTKKPTGQTKGEVSLTMGSFDLYRTTLDLDGKLSKDGRLLYRLNLAAQNKRSHRANEFNNRYAIAPVLSYQLDDKTKLTAEYDFQYARMSDVGSYYIFATDGYAKYPVGFTTLPSGMPATTISDHSFFTNLEHQFNDNWKVTTQLAYLKYRQQGTSLWPSTVNPDGTMIRTASSWDAKSDMTLAQAFVNGNVQTGAIRHRLLGGIDIGNKEYFADWGQYHDLDSVGAEFDSNNPYYGVPANGYPDFDYSAPLEQRAVAIGGTMDQRYTGVYLQDELGFFENKLRLTLAGRYTTVKQSEWGEAPKGAEHFTPRVAVSVSVDKETSVYALYDQAFIPQSGKVAVGTVKPLTGKNFEVGLKKDWAGGKWNSTVSVYRIFRNNELTPDPNSPPNAGLSIVLGEKRSEGVEIDVRGRIVNGLNVAANYAYTDSRVTKVTEGVESLKEGDVVPGYAKHTANGWLTYKIRSGAFRGLGFSGGITWLLGRETYWDPSPQGGAVLPDYLKMDAGISWEQDRLKITANVFNVLDKYLYSGSYYSYLNAYYWQTDPPRNVRLSFNYSF